MMNIFNDLNDRGLISQTSDVAELQNLFDSPQTIYCGFDPTAGSLHIGHLVPLIMLKRLQKAGHKVIALIGGATGMIGDPSFKDSERTLNSAEQVGEWVERLGIQIEELVGEPILIENNADWFRSINIIDFFRDTGKHFSVNAMLKRDSVKQRLQRAEQGISFTEFSYALLQAHDFAELNRRHQCKLQIGGNDQWGNILDGIDLTRRLNQCRVSGMTLPLITKADGTKFGKTESGTIWLDPDKTSAYRFYQFWLSVDDKDVYNLLRYYTFLSTEDIAAIELADKTRGNKPEAQQILAKEVTALVHGQASLESAIRITSALFSGEVNKLSLSEIRQLEMDGLPLVKTLQQELVLLLTLTGLASSRREARELIACNAVSVNGKKVSSDTSSVGQPLFNTYWILQKGKKQFCLIKRERGQHRKNDACRQPRTINRASLLTKLRI